MTSSQRHTIEIKVRNPAAYTLTTVAASPRTCTPTDIKIAGANVQIDCGSEAPPNEVVEFIDFLVTQFFALAHKSGLYNRQRVLWECIARSTRVTANKVSQGMFKKIELPVFDLFFEDGQGMPMLFATLLQRDKIFDDQKQKAEAFKDCLKRLEHAQRKQNTMRGLFFCCPDPFPESVLARVGELTGAHDPVARYESLLPQPWSIPINLIAMGAETEGDFERDEEITSSEDYEEAPSGGEDGEIVDRIEDKAVSVALEAENDKQVRGNVFRLIHPDLSRGRKSVRSPSA
ncbi:MAG TPA: hypothetical protein V6D17_04210 [Candidatus Obscuribacterales bacterium]